LTVETFATEIAELVCLTFVVVECNVISYKAAGDCRMRSSDLLGVWLFVFKAVSGLYTYVVVRQWIAEASLDRVECCCLHGTWANETVSTWV
jgi:hypothetical protein